MSSGWNHHFPLPRTDFEPGSSTSSCVGTRVSDYVKLNVGGSLFYTTKSTLTKHDCMFRAMFSGRMEVHKDPEGKLGVKGPPQGLPTTSPFSLPGWIIIDRCGTYFGTILNFLRDESCVLPETMKGVLELLAEAKYYCIKYANPSAKRHSLSSANQFHTDQCFSVSWRRVARRHCPRRSATWIPFAGCPSSRRPRRSKC